MALFVVDRVPDGTTDVDTVAHVLLALVPV